MYFINVIYPNCVGGNMPLYMGEIYGYEIAILAAQEYAKSPKILCVYVYSSDSDDLVYENKGGVEIFYA